MHKIIHDVKTGDITQIELTTKEIAELEAEKAKFEAEAALKQTEEATKAAEKTAVLAKLGLTADEVAALLS
jgi:hypothetical protein